MKVYAVILLGGSTDIGSIATSTTVRPDHSIYTVPVHLPCGRSIVLSINKYVSAGAPIGVTKYVGAIISTDNEEDRNDYILSCLDADYPTYIVGDKPLTSVIRSLAEYIVNNDSLCYKDIVSQVRVKIMEIEYLLSQA